MNTFYIRRKKCIHVIYVAWQTSGEGQTLAGEAGRGRSPPYFHRWREKMQKNTFKLAFILKYILPMILYQRRFGTTLLRGARSKLYVGLTFESSNDVMCND